MRAWRTHVPLHVTADEAQVAGLLEAGPAELVPATASGLLCTPVPFLAVDGVPLAHSPQWREPVVEQARPSPV
ncbi:MAG: hypothetical protein JWM64_1636 [Frankiales bacterium]|nr:hypothetical protein [Frankiales bacterium]